MAILFHPDAGTVLICDFAGFKVPEIVKRRPVIVVSPRFKRRDQLCTVVPLSTTAPRWPQEYNCRIEFDPPLPAPYAASDMWVKGDMLCTVAFERLSPPAAGRGADGRRIYDIRRVSDAELSRVRACVLNGLGLGGLTAALQNS